MNEQRGEKRAIDRPCSACSGGDYRMEYHDHFPPFRGERGEHPNIDELRELLRRLDAILVDPHPGLMTWRQAYGRALQNLADWINS